MQTMLVLSSLGGFNGRQSQLRFSLFVFCDIAILNKTGIPLPESGCNLAFSFVASLYLSLSTSVTSSLVYFLSKL